MIETIGIMCGIALGLFGSVFSVVQFFYQRLKDREQAQREYQRDKEQAEKQDKKDRLDFLKEMIIDQDISIEGRRPFYEEYLSLGGNGAVVRFWNHEVERPKRIAGKGD